MSKYRLMLLVGVTVVVALLSAAASSNVALLSVEQVVRGALVGIGLWALHAARQFYLKVEQMLKQWPNVVDAIWGAPNPEGKRRGGLLQITSETGETARRTEAEVQALHKLIEKNLIQRNPTARTRSDDDS